MLKHVFTVLFALTLTTLAACATDPSDPTGTDPGGTDPGGGSGTDPGSLPPNGDIYFNKHSGFAMFVPQGYTHVEVACPDCNTLLDVQGDTMDGMFQVKYLPSATVVACDKIYALTEGAAVADCGADMFHSSCAPIVVGSATSGSDGDANVYTACGELIRAGSGDKYHFAIELDDPNQAVRFTQLLEKSRLLF
jgi:hypothetical protein